MYSFENDYSEGACRQVLENLIKTNLMQDAGYGVDEHCKNAESMLKGMLERDDIDVHFITGGTPCNMLAISLLKPYEAVIACESGHINVHETGAIEHGGHKILTTKGKDGKISPEEIEEIYLRHTDEHMVKPKMVFISNASEYGTVYTKEELLGIKEVCERYGLYLYLDGARLSNALVALKGELTLKDIGKICDMFYLGGTKNGALLGEAMVIINDELKENFRYSMKQNGAMLAKGFIIGKQFEALLSDDLYLKNAAHANMMASLIRECLVRNNIGLFIDSPTNQIFPILPNELRDRLKEKYVFLDWGKYDGDHTTVRLVCSWATKKEALEELIRDIEKPAY